MMINADYKNLEHYLSIQHDNNNNNNNNNSIPAFLA